MYVKWLISEIRHAVKFKKKTQHEHSDTGIKEKYTFLCFNKGIVGKIILPIFVCKIGKMEARLMFPLQS